MFLSKLLPYCGDIVVSSVLTNLVVLLTRIGVRSWCLNDCQDGVIEFYFAQMFLSRVTTA